jgi:hypothetical protein
VESHIEARGLEMHIIVAGVLKHGKIKFIKSAPTKNGGREFKD